MFWGLLMSKYYKFTEVFRVVVFWGLHMSKYYKFAEVYTRLWVLGVLV